MNNIGIYKIQNNVNGKIYIGSSKNMKIRKGQHFSELKNGYHVNPYLQHSWDKYGKESFSFIIIENCKEEDLLTREQFYINKYYDNQQKCFNLNPKAINPPVKMIETFLYDKDGNFYKAFDSIRECANFLNVHESSVGRIAK